MRRMASKFRTALLAAMLGPLIMACTYRGGDDPVTRKLTWFSYLNGDDLRAECVQGAPERYRFVYNGVYVEQVRMYEVSARVPAQTGQLNIRAIGPTRLGSVSIGRPADLLSPWQGKTASAILAPEDLAALRQATRESGVFDATPRGLQLRSEDFYWIVAACVDGRFTFNAYRWPSPRFEAARFAELLFAWDRTGVPVNPPRAVDPNWLYVEPDGQDLSNQPIFTLSVGENGLRGVSRLF